MITDARVSRARASYSTIDITTRGRKTGLPRRTKIWFHDLDGRYYITNAPGPWRGWYANLVANPAFTFHPNHGAQADIPARARPVIQQNERRQVEEGILQKLGNAGDLDRRAASIPLVEVELDAD